MRTLALITVLLAGSLFAFGQNTPPGGDLVGSDHAHASAGPHSTRSRDTQQNQRMTGTTGSTTGASGSPAYAGSSVYGNTAAQSGSGAKGQAGTTSAVAGRQRAYNQRGSAQDTSAENQTSVVPSGQGGAATDASSKQAHASTPHAKHHRRKTQPPPKQEPPKQ